MSEWSAVSPIYLQLRGKVLQGILNGSLPEGEAVPSVRQVAAEEKINPITVSKAYQMLVDEELLEKRRGLGLFVQPGARDKALHQERELFLREEWPDIRARIVSLGLDARALFEEQPQ